jgi:hypothetical protein
VEEEGTDLDVDLDEEEVNDLEDLEDDYLDDYLEEEDVEEEKIISVSDVLRTGSTES